MWCRATQTWSRFNILTYVISVIALSCQSSAKSTQHCTSVLSKAWLSSSYIQIQLFRFYMQFLIDTPRIQICWLKLNDFKYATLSTQTHARFICSWRKYLVGISFASEFSLTNCSGCLIYCCLFNRWSFHLIPWSSFVELIS